MKKIFFTALFIAGLLAATNIHAQQNQFGLGVMVGAPTGLSGKYWVNDDNAIDFGIAYSFVEANNAFSFHADYLFHAKGWFPKLDKLDFYYGYGLRIRTNKDQTSLGARGVAGLALMLKDSPVNIFVELAPVFKFIPSTALNLDASIGARYYF